MIPDLAAAVRASLRGDPAPFDAAAVALWPALRARAARILRDDDAAEDAAADAILDARAHLRALRDPDAARAWLLGIVANRARSAVRAAVARRHREAAAARPEAFRDPLPGDLPLDPADVSPPVAAALARLTETERDAARGIFLSGRTVRAYADDAGISLGAAKVRASRARAKLRAFLTR